MVDSKVIRSAISILSLAALAGCGSGDQAGGDLTAPTALAATSRTTTQTICSDPAHTELSFDLNTWVPAQFAGELGPPYGQKLPGSTWVGPYPLSGIVQATQPGTFYFRDTFTIPVGSKSVALEGAVHADNWSVWYLNGVEFFSQPQVIQYSAFQDPPDSLDAVNSGFVEGLNVVRVTLVNAADASQLPSSTALDYCFTVSYVPPDTTGTGGGPGGGGGGGGGATKKGCPAAPSIAAHYLQTLGLQPTSYQGKNIVALVADHMTQGARFEGFDKCDLRYAPAVIAYVNARLP